jgi:hypothetical protein
MNFCRQITLRGTPVTVLTYVVILFGVVGVSGFSGCDSGQHGANLRVHQRGVVSMRLFGDNPRVKLPFEPKSELPGLRKSTRLRNSRRYGYYDKLDRMSGMDYKFKRNGNETDLVDTLQDFVDKAPGPLSRIVSDEMWHDCRVRSLVYKSDWTDAFKKKRQVIPAILFLYFACLSPAVSFGTIASEITNGSIGIVEFLLSCGGAGMVGYSVLQYTFWCRCMPHYSSPISAILVGIFHFVRAAYGISRSNRTDISIYRGSISLLQAE